MATVYTHRCDICGKKAIKSESYSIGVAGRKQYIVCKKCGRPLNAFLKKNGIAKIVHPRVSRSERAQKLKTRRRS